MENLIFGLLNFLLLTTPFVFTWINQELFEFNKMLWVYLFAILLMSAWVINWVKTKQIRWFQTKLTLPLALFLCSQILSSIFSIHTTTSIFGYYSRLHGGLLSTLAYLVIFLVMVNNLKQKHLKPLLDTTLIGALLVSIYAIFEHFGHSPSCLMIIKEFSVSCWVQDVQNRVFASFGQPNWLAAYLIMLIPISVNFFLQTSRAHSSTTASSLFRQKIFYWLTSCLMLAALIFTKSRSGLLGLAVAMAIVFIYELIKNNWSRQFSLILASFAFIAISFGTAVTPSLSQLWQRLTSTTQPVIADNAASPAAAGSLEGGTESGEIRKIVWQGAWAVWRRYPIFGSGVETFAYSYYQDRPMAHNLVSEWDFLYNKAHNELLNFLATGGLIGLLSYLFWCAATFWIAFKPIAFKPIENNKAENPRRLLDLDRIMQTKAAIGASLIALFISNTLGFSTVTVTMLMFVLAGMLCLLQTPAQTSPTYKKIPLPALAQGIIPVLALLFFIFSTNKIYQFWRADYLFTQGKSLIDANELNAGLKKIQAALKLTPQQPIFYEELAANYADLAVQLHQLQQTNGGSASASAQAADPQFQESISKFEQTSLAASQFTLELNPRQLNFYKSQARLYITLAQLNPDYLIEAEQTFLKALQLAPTDAKLMYSLSLVQDKLGKNEASLNSLKTAIAMKDNYLQARMELAKRLEMQQQYSDAIQEYRYLLVNYVPDDALLLQKIITLEASAATQASSAAQITN